MSLWHLPHGAPRQDLQGAIIFQYQYKKLGYINIVYDFTEERVNKSMADIVTSLQQMLNQVIVFLPNLLAAIIILVIDGSWAGFLGRPSHHSLTGWALSVAE